MPVKLWFDLPSFFVLPSRGGKAARIVNRHPNLVALLAFVLLTLVMTYPNALRLTDAAKDLGDPLLNSWIMWWVVDSAVHGNVAGFFDANLFFPHYRTLAYSEFLIPQALVGAPILLLSGNPLLAYNVVLLLSFIATAFAMYLLGRYLTGSGLAGFIGGLALAYAPFQIHHLSQIQVIGALGIPLAFLFLHRYFDSGSLKYLLGFTAVYVLQALGNAYYAVYLTYAAGAYILYRAVIDRRFMQVVFWRHMGLHALLSLVVLAPFYRQYLALRTELGFVRPLSSEAGWYSFLATSPTNRLYGSITEDLLGDEAMFPGFTVALLALVGLFASRNRPDRRAGPHPDDNQVDESERDDSGVRSAERRRSVAVWAYRLAGLLVAAGCVLVAMTATGGFEATVFGVRVSAHRPVNPLIQIGLLIALRAVLRWRNPGLEREGRWLQEPQRFYAWMLAATVLLSLGADGPYRLLYHYVPGFDGIRGAGRIHIMTLLGLAVFAAYGTRALTSRLSGRRWAAAALLLPALICVELFSAPLPLVDLPGEGAVPEAYAWLAAQEGDYAAIEYPLDGYTEYQRLYFSVFHSKKIVNGASGYNSPVYQEMLHRNDWFPSQRAFDDIRRLGIRWVIVHPDGYGDEWPEIRSRLEEHSADLHPLARFDAALVYELQGGEWLTREDVHGQLADPDAGWVILPRAGWSVAAVPNDPLAGLAVDGDMKTRWETRAQRPGDYFEVDFGKIETVGSLVMALDISRTDSPRGYRVEVSGDGVEWHVLAEEPSAHVPITQFLTRRDAFVEIEFPEARARYLRVVQTGEDPVYYWSIHELDVRKRRAGTP